jgi:hypothetical protein
MSKVEKASAMLQRRHKRDNLANKKIKTETLADNGSSITCANG